MLFAPYAVRSPEATSGLYSRGLFWWLNPLFWLGFRGVVNDADLFAADGDLLSESCEVRFTKVWANRASSILLYLLFRELITT
jgi:ATP-binding cassette subfamily C (CFTR/MRP) protein 1